MSLLMLSTSHDADINAVCHMTLMPMASQDKESQIAPHCNCLNIENVTVPLLLLLALCDTNASANGIKGPKNSSCTFF